MFCKSYRQLAGALRLSLYCMKCNRHVIALLYHYALAIVLEAILARRQRCYDGDQGVKPVTTEIMAVLRRWIQAQDDDGHIISLILIACDVYLLCILSCFD